MKQQQQQQQPWMYPPERTHGLETDCCPPHNQLGISTITLTYASADLLVCFQKLPSRIMTQTSAYI